MCPVLSELTRGSGEWWLFTPDGDSRYWFMVDYLGKRMWGNMCNRIQMCFWSDPWELGSWRLGEKATYNAEDFDGWFGYQFLRGDGLWP